MGYVFMTHAWTIIHITQFLKCNATCAENTEEANAFIYKKKHYIRSSAQINGDEKTTALNKYWENKKLFHAGWLFLT